VVGAESAQAVFGVSQSCIANDWKLRVECTCLCRQALPENSNGRNVQR
jgi:hypothetical protein